MPDTVETIKLNDFEHNFFLRLDESRQEKRYCDVRFDIKGKIFHCHRLVLATASPYFDTMFNWFNGNFKQTNSDIISMKSIEPEAFEEILNAIYSSKIHLLSSNVYFVLKASNLLLLEEVENVCISYILKNCSRIHYLIDTCLFAKIMQRKELYSKCVNTITSDLINLGKTEAFSKIPIDVFRSILFKWKPKNNEEESTMLLISKWIKENEASREDILSLLESSRLKATNYINPVLMALLLETSDDVNVIAINNETSQEIDDDTHLDLNLYVNLIDVNTGQKGWGVLKLNDKFDKYALISFHPTNSLYKRVCKVGSKFYCFEYLVDEQKNVFSCFDQNNVQTLLPLPPDHLFRYFKIASTGTSIHLMSRNEDNFMVWTFDCEKKTWQKTINGNGIEKCTDIAAYTFVNGYFYVIASEFTLKKPRFDRLYSVDSQSSAVREIKFTPNDYDQYIICAFEDKIALWGRDEDDHNYLIEILDLQTENWLLCRKPMNVKRQQFNLINHKGCLFVLENKRAITNEKYDLETHTWTDLPALPKKVALKNKNKVAVLATGSIFGSGSDIVPN